MPNPFYQIYEGAALLAGAEPYCVNALAANGFAPAWRDVPDAVWSRTQLVYVCSPDNPTGRVTTPRRMGVPVRTVGPARLRDRGRRVLLRDLFRRGQSAGRRARGGAGDGASAAFRASWPSAACPSDRTRPDCARATSRAMPHSSRLSCCTAPITAPRCRRPSRPRASRRGRTKRTCARTAPNTRPSSRELQPKLAAALCPARCPTRRFTCGRRTPIDDADFAKRLLAEQAVAMLREAFWRAKPTA